MKKILMMLLCAATVALVGCNNKDNDPQPDPQPEYDLNGEADWEVRFYTTDTFLLYANYSIIDSLNPSLDCAQTTIQNFDTLHKADKAMWMYGIINIPISQLRVIVLPVRLKVGDHRFKITFTRNQTPFVTNTLTHSMTTGVYFYTTNSKVIHGGSIYSSTYYGDIENMDEFFPELLSDCSKLSFDLSFKMYK